MGLSLYFNQYQQLCNDTVMLPKQSKVREGKIKKENPEDPTSIPPDILFPKYLTGKDKKEKLEYII